MVFGKILDRVEGRRRSLVFYNVEGRTEEIDRIIEYVGAHDVDIEYATDEGLPASTVAVRDDDETLSVDAIADVYEYLIAWESAMTASTEVPSLFAALDETMFRSRNKRQLVLASRLIETRAATVGCGRLSAGFQRLSLSRAQLPFYKHLPETVSVSLYGTADWIPSTESGIAAYEPTADEHTDYWWVLFDGPDRQAALVAAERTPGEYTGFWTYRPTVVEKIRGIVDGLDCQRVYRDE